MLDLPRLRPLDDEPCLGVGAEGSMSNEKITDPEIRDALSRVMGSPVFVQAEQLRAFLGYIVEAELAGRGSSLNEYLIGVEALGRPQGYSPMEDSIVRNRALSLRKRLSEYYESEGIGDPIQISVPKGGYRPAFNCVSELLPSPPPHEAPPSNLSRWRRDAGFAALGAAVCLVMALSFFNRRDESAIDPIVRNTLGPLLEPGGSSLIIVATGAHLLLRPENTIVPAGTPGTPAPDLVSWRSGLGHVPPAREVHLRSAVTSAMWGDVVATATVSKLMLAAGTNAKLLPEAATSMAVLRDSNAVIIGRPEYSVIATSLMRGAQLSIEYSPAISEYGVVEISNQAGTPPLYSPVFDSTQRSRIVYGLVTVLPSQAASSAHSRTVILSGTTSPGTQAAAEFISSPDLLRAFYRDLAQDGHAAPPEAYQAVVRAEVTGSIALEVEYVTYRTIPLRGGSRLASRYDVEGSAKSDLQGPARQ